MKPAELALKLKERYKKQGAKETLRYLKTKLKTHDSLPWSEYNEGQGALERQHAQNRITEGPLVSIVVPVYNIEICWLDKCIQSVINQTYTNWQLCLADDCSSDPNVRPALEAWAKRESRIKLVFRTENGHISEATNSAIEAADGELIAFMDDDDELVPNALEETVRLFTEDKQIDFVYTDEDKINEHGVRFNPFYKPDFNWMLLRSHNYITHFVVVRKSLLDEVGPLCSKYNGAQDYDFVLRATQKARKVGHVPQILYHWRTIAGSAAGNPSAKLYAYEAGKKALDDSYARLGIPAQVETARQHGVYNTVFYPDQEPSVCIILTNATSGDPAPYIDCAQDLLYSTDYNNYNIMLVNCGEVGGDNVIALNDTAQRSPLELMNYAASRTQADYVLFLRDAIRPDEKDWLKRLVNVAKLPNTAVAAPRVLNAMYGTWHAGVSVKDGARWYPQSDHQPYDLGYYYRLFADQEVFAVDLDCMLTERAVFERLGGFNTKLSPLDADLDYCVRVRKEGLSVVIANRSLMRMDTFNEKNGAPAVGFYETYKGLQRVDPYINPNLYAPEPWLEFLQF